jgi:hypothetical protein
VTTPLERSKGGAMHFLIGFLIVVVILAIPALRNAALILVGLGALAIMILIHPQTGPSSVSQPPSPQELAAEETARQIAAEQDEKSKTLIKANQIDIRQIWATSSGFPVNSMAGPISSLSSPGASAVVRNNSSKAILKEIGVTIHLFDCPAETLTISSNCDQFGTYTTTMQADVPPHQVKQMDSSFDLSAKPVSNIPPIRGTIVTSYEINFLRGEDLPTSTSDYDKTVPSVESDPVNSIFVRGAATYIKLADGAEMPLPDYLNLPDSEKAKNPPLKWPNNSRIKALDILRKRLTPVRDQ